MSDGTARPALRRRLANELREFTVIAIYLFICFAALINMKAAILHAQGVAFSPYGPAAIKALLLAKFISVGNVLKLGRRFKHQGLIWLTFYKSLVFFTLLLALNALEEIGVGLIHHRSIGESILAIAGGTLDQLVAASFVMLLILIPFFAFRTLGEVVGEDNLVRVFLHSRPAPQLLGDAN
jgi:hypothetical protein